MQSFSLYDFRDQDLLLKLADEEDDEGWVETRALANSLGVDEAEKLNGIGVRLAWMRRIGLLEFDEKRRLWKLSASGDRIRRAKLKAATVNQIEAVPAEALVDVMAHVTARYRHSDPVTAAVLRRESRFGTAPNSRAWNGR